MSVVPRFIAILLVSFSSGGGEESELILLGSSAVPRTVLTQSQETYLPIFCRAHFPSPFETFFERRDETALDEEDSSRVDDHGLAAVAFLGFEASLINGWLPPASPASLRVGSAPITPILRC
jgi:hypothetical protein